MKNKFKKFLGYFPSFVLEYYEMLFADAAENHLKIIEAGKKKFPSYTQLKRHQKNVRRAVTIAILAIFSLLAGIVVGPIFFPQPAETEVYIPNGKGDILVGNVSKNQATVIFKTLDSANGNKPLATKSIVEFYEDQEFTDLARRTTEDDYAVTHIVPVDSLQEGKIYYIKIITRDAADPVHSKVVSTWGGGSEPIKFFTTGDIISNCIEGEKVKDREKPSIDEEVVIATGIEKVKVPDNFGDTPILDPLILQIQNVQNENYLQPGNKVQSIISWITNLPSSTSIIIGEEKSGEKKQLIISDELTTKHAAVLTTLKTGKTYYFSVESRDADGNPVVSEEYSLRTPRAQENIVQKISNNFKGLIGQIKPR